MWKTQGIFRFPPFVVEAVGLYPPRAPVGSPRASSKKMASKATNSRQGKPGAPVFAYPNPWESLVDSRADPSEEMDLQDDGTLFRGTNAQAPPTADPSNDMEVLRDSMDEASKDKDHSLPDDFMKDVPPRTTEDRDQLSEVEDETGIPLRGKRFRHGRGPEHGEACRRSNTHGRAHRKGSL